MGELEWELTSYTIGDGMRKTGACSGPASCPGIEMAVNLDELVGLFLKSCFPVDAAHELLPMEGEGDENRELATPAMTEDVGSLLIGSVLRGAQQAERLWLVEVVIDGFGVVALLAVTDAGADRLLTRDVLGDVVRD